MFMRFENVLLFIITSLEHIYYHGCGKELKKKACNLLRSLDRCYEKILDFTFSETDKKTEEIGQILSKLKLQVEKSEFHDSGEAVRWEDIAALVSRLDSLLTAESGREMR